MSQVGALTRQTTVEQASQVGQVGPTLVRPDADLAALAEAVAANPAARTLAVVDEKTERLVGVIEQRALLEDVFFEVDPGEFLRDLARTTPGRQLRDIAARTARELMRSPIAVRPDETAKDAFERMHRAHLVGLPIVDTGGRVIGYLDLAELLGVWLQAYRRAGSPVASDTTEPGHPESDPREMPA